MLGELPWKPGSFGMRLSILTGWDGAGGALQWGAEGCSPKLSRDSGSGAPCKQGGKPFPASPTRLYSLLINGAETS